MITAEENGRAIKQASVKSDENGLITFYFNPGWVENSDGLKIKRNNIAIKVNDRQNSMPK